MEKGAACADKPTVLGKRKMVEGLTPVFHGSETKRMKSGPVCAAPNFSNSQPLGFDFRVFEPWDLLRGRCVFRDRPQLLKEAQKARLSHWAPNCATFSRAREIPIPGVANPPRPVRSEASPRGIPEELEKMSQKSKKKLEDDTSMADLSADQCLQAHLEKDYFTLEHPGRSLAHDLESWKRLA